MKRMTTTEYCGHRRRYRRLWCKTVGRVGTGKHWCCSRHRWLTGRQKLGTLGFPISNEVAQSMGVPPVPVRCTKRAEHVAGNAMHFSNVAIMQLIALSCFAQV